MNVVSKMNPVVPPYFSGGADDHVTCRMCLVKFSYPTRLPLSLNCLHTFCSQCVYGWTCNKTKQKLSCPMCGKITKLDRGRKVQECLPVNHAVLELAAMADQNGSYAGNMNQGFVSQGNQAFSHARAMPNTGAQYDCMMSNTQLATNDYAFGASAAENCKIYPNIPPVQTNYSGGYNDEMSQCRMKPVEQSCGGMCGQQSNPCCGAPKCEPNTGKPQPVLQINIGDARFHKIENDDDGFVERRSSPCLRDELKPGAVTELSVNRSPRNVKRLPEVPRTTCIAKISSDMCAKCSQHPATVTVTNSAEKSVQRLCSECHTAVKEERKQDERECKVECHKSKAALADATNQARTVIKIQSKLANTEVARSSPVQESKQKQLSCGETAGIPSVLRLGDNIRSATPNTTASNQVGVVCGPFKSEPSSQNVEKVVECSTRENIEFRKSAERTVFSEKQGTANVEVSAPTTFDIGTIDSGIIKRTSAYAREELRANARRQNAAAPSRPHPVLEVRAAPQETRVRPREYVVSASGRRSDGGVLSDEMNRPDAFNPQYNEMTDFDTQSISDLGLPTVQPVDLLQRATTKEQEALGYNNSQTTVNYPTLSSPPRYEEIMAEANGINGVSKEIRSGSGFGRYGEGSNQPGALRNPSYVSVSSDDRVCVVDAANRTVQLFNGFTGECLSLLQVDGVNGCCLVRDGSLVVATNRGVDVYKANGVPSKKVEMGAVVAVAAYKNGFVSAQPKALVAFKDLNGASNTISEIWKGNRSQTKSFSGIVDVAVSPQQAFVVLDKDIIYILGDDGAVRSVMKPSTQPCGPLLKPSTVAVDDRHNVVVCDSGRVLVFNGRGQYVRDVPHTGRGRAVAAGVGRNGRAYVAVRGDRYAEILAVSY